MAIAPAAYKRETASAQRFRRVRLEELVGSQRQRQTDDRDRVPVDLALCMGFASGNNDEIAMSMLPGP